MDGPPGACKTTSASFNARINFLASFVNANFPLKNRTMKNSNCAILDSSFGKRSIWITFSGIPGYGVNPLLEIVIVAPGYFIRSSSTIALTAASSPLFALCE